MVDEDTRVVMLLEQIHQDVSLQPRESLTVEKVQEYAQNYKDGVNMPAIEVWYIDGADDDRPVLVDGFHRFAAAISIDMDRLPCVVCSGSRADAVFRACGVNATNGVHMTSADKRRAVNMALDLPEAADMSLREIAKKCHCGHDLVHRIKQDRIKVAGLEGGDSGESAKTAKSPGKVSEKDSSETAAPVKNDIPEGSAAEPDTPTAETEMAIAGRRAMYIRKELAAAIDRGAMARVRREWLVGCVIMCGLDNQVDMAWADIMQDPWSEFSERVTGQLSAMLVLDCMETDTLPPLSEIAELCRLDMAELERDAERLIPMPRDQEVSDVDG